MKNYRIKNKGIVLWLAFSLFLYNSVQVAAQEIAIGTLEIVAEMDVNPGNVAVSKEGRVFSTIHPLRPYKFQLVEITGKTSYVPFPNKELQSTEDTKSDSKFDAPLGVLFDNKNRLWVVDLGFKIGYTRLFAYDIDTKEELMRFDIPKELAPNDSFLQDFAVDEINEFVYLADPVKAVIIVIDIKKKEYRKIVDVPSMQSEDIDIVIDGKVQTWMGNPARISVDPITLSADRETLYYGPMNGYTWYQLPTKNIREGESNDELVKRVSLVGEKPFSDGAATDDNGNHYFTNIQNYSIDMLSKDGQLTTLIKDPLLDWPDSIRIHGDWMFIAANQINKSPAFTTGVELSTAPFLVLKLKYR
ncbi:L-dopachrome tautomerase-related protein [Zobellia sp. OII3]|uniref:L-dopachrome tautomerase-related protein n=1 Tax=Zobellia sp. OII3 TaxID=2034520 RepID=UPI0013747F48|nr:L-dopachrome tautomerase-related protein [Zobellia sp. OII3]